jgi:glycosyltransferase involved in cell wall biosynthesis
MKLRLAWLADPPDGDSYSAREARVLLRALARREDVVVLWFAVGAARPAQFWSGVRVFPIPAESTGSAEFLQTLLDQQRPNVILSNVAWSSFPAGLWHLERQSVPWIHRVNPADARSPAFPKASLILCPENADGQPAVGVVAVPYLRGLDSAFQEGTDATAVLTAVRQAIQTALLSINVGQRVSPAPQSPSPHWAGETRCPTLVDGTHLVMRQQLFCNASLAHVMFELTNALIELGVPTVPQDEHSIFSKDFIHREEDLFRTGAPEKLRRILECLGRRYDPERAVTVHFSMLKTGLRCSSFGMFPSLTLRDVLYTTGNHTVKRDLLRLLTDRFERILAPSKHVLQPYIEAGLSPNCGAVIPHGIDPAVFTPASPPHAYVTTKTFKFLQTSFPWVYEKGFDLSIKAFCRGFSSSDDVALILRTPRVTDPGTRAQSFNRLEALVREAAATPRAPEILLIEEDVPLNCRGGVYTAADCYLFPLRAEGFAMTVLEAMGCGLPVIATPWSGPADYLSPRYTYTVRHSNPVPETARDGNLLRFHVEPDLDHLVYLMRHVYEHRDEAEEMGRRGCAVARRDWTWERAAVKLASLFRLLPESHAQEPAGDRSVVPQ